MRTFNRRPSRLDKGVYKVYNHSKHSNPSGGSPMKKTIGATDLRQRLTDVLQAVRERRETYVVETFGRPQAAIINLDEYRQFRRFQEEREAFFEWLEDTAARNAQRNVGLSDEEVLALIEDAREEVASAAG
jgi:prevent-host-death family protein